MKTIRFICGCSIPLDERQRVVSEDEMVTEFHIQGRVKKDAFGLLICGEHGLRRYGWQSLPTVTLVSENGDESETDRPDYSYAGATPLELETEFLRRNSIVVG